MNKTNGDQAAAKNSTDAVCQPWMEYWMNLFEQNSDWTQALMAGAPKNVDPKSIRKEWLDAMSKSMEAFMRSPTFLESMRRNSEMMATTKVTADLAKQEIARQAGIPHVEDIHGLYVRLETANDVLLERLLAMEKRLESIEQKLDSKLKKTAGKEK